VWTESGRDFAKWRSALRTIWAFYRLRRRFDEFFDWPEPLHANSDHAHRQIAVPFAAAIGLVAGRPDWCIMIQRPDQLLAGLAWRGNRDHEVSELLTIKRKWLAGGL